MSTFMAYVSVQTMILVGMLSEKFGLSFTQPIPLVKTRCGWANQIMTELNPIVGEFQGVALSLGTVIWIFVLLALVVGAALTKHGKMLLVVALTVMIAGLLIQADFNPVSSPCKSA